MRTLGGGLSARRKVMPSPACPFTTHGSRRRADIPVVTAGCTMGPVRIVCGTQNMAAIRNPAQMKIAEAIAQIQLCASRPPMTAATIAVAIAIARTIMSRSILIMRGPAALARRVSLWKPGSVIVLALALPLACWALTARTTRTGWVVAVLLACCAGAGIVGAKARLLGGERLTLVTVSVIASAVVLTAGIAAEWHQAGGLRHARVRVVAGLLVSAACIAVSLVGVAMFTLEILVGGTPASVPPATGVLPAPGRLVVTSNQNQGCSSGSATICTRQIVIQGSAGLPGLQVARQILAQVTRSYGWHLTGGAGYWDGCRTEGWLLDRHQVCMTIAASQQQATVTIQTSDTW